MPYEPTNWKSGDVVTSAKLNKLENAVAGLSGVLIVNATTEDDVTTLDKTWQEIHDAKVCAIISGVENDFTVDFVSAVNIIDAESYAIASGQNLYYAETADGYPVKSGGK